MSIDRIIRIASASKSYIKSNTVKDYFTNKVYELNGKKLKIFPIDITYALLPNQPLNKDGPKSCKKRLTYVVECFSNKVYHYDYIVSIENFINTKTQKDYCYVIVRKSIEDEIEEHYGISYGISCNPDILIECLIQTEKTYGDLIHEKDETIPSNDWMSSVGYPRKDQIQNALYHALTKFTICESITNHQDFPKKGVLFQNVVPIFQANLNFKLLIRIIAKEVKDYNIDYIVGLESRGFLIGPTLAYKMLKGFIPIRKAGKLPGEVVSGSYEKEYGMDVFEMSKLPDLKGKRILIVDDLVATGGSLKCAIDLCEKNGLKVVAALVLKDVPELRSKYKELIPNTDILVIL